MLPLLDVSTILPPVALHVTATAIVSPAAVKPTAVNCDVWLGWSVICEGARATRLTTGPDGPEPGPVTPAGFSQASAVTETNRSASFSRAKRTESLYLKVMATRLPRAAGAHL